MPFETKILTTLWRNPWFLVWVVLKKTLCSLHLPQKIVKHWLTVRVWENTLETHGSPQCFKSQLNSIIIWSCNLDCLTIAFSLMKFLEEIFATYRLVFRRVSYFCESTSSSNDSIAGRFTVSGSRCCIPSRGRTRFCVQRKKSEVTTRSQLHAYLTVIVHCHAVK